MNMLAMMKHVGRYRCRVADRGNDQVNVEAMIVSIERCTSWSWASVIEDTFGVQHGPNLSIFREVVNLQTVD